MGALNKDIHRSYYQQRDLVSFAQISPFLALFNHAMGTRCTLLIV